MDRYDIYQQIAQRTKGDIYLGVVGPVRTGKSTFIKRFMDLLVIPNISDNFERDRAIDELPQSASGKTIMTTEPKFIPNEAANITIGDHINLKVRLVDCVGYLVEEALGHLENDVPRMVSTPWFEEKIPFGEAAEIGTRKVINEHSTIGVVITTDGSVTDIRRDSYQDAEERVIQEMQSTGKPYIIILNCVDPEAETAIATKHELENKYSVPVLPINCALMTIDDITDVMQTILYEFPIGEISFYVPDWIISLDYEDSLKASLLDAIVESFTLAEKIRNVKTSSALLENYAFVKKAVINSINAGDGSASIDILVADELFYKILSEKSGLEIADDKALIAMISDLGRIKREHERLESALKEVELKGYGIVMPTQGEMQLEEPEIVKQGSRFGVRLRAKAPSIHMIKADIETEIAPFVGTEKQSEELVDYILKEFEGNPSSIWSSNLFGKPLNELMGEGLQNKLNKVPDSERLKLQETIERVINEGIGGLVCIIL
ncbi:MAG: stage IV sporulation protein A [Ruminococcaceae bacterium]|nr:stage IV sporulation protein A [Oscillospiraceae bacterium]